MNMVYMPAGREVWKEVSKELYTRSIHPKIWLGDPAHDEFAKSNYKDCLVLDFFKIHKVIDLESKGLKVNREHIKDKCFYMLKDQVYKMMDRQDEFGMFGRLEREAFFYALFFYFYTIVIEKNINILVASEGPHSPASMTLYGVCKILGIKTYHLSQNSITPIAHICTDFYGGKLKLKNNLEHEHSRHKENIRNYIGSISDDIPVPHYMKAQKDFDIKSEGVSFKLNKYFFNPVKQLVFKKGSGRGYSIYRREFFKNNKKPLLYENLIGNRKNDLFAGYKAALSEFDLSKEFVYVPLHYEPERTSNPDGGDFYNAYDMIMSLRSLLPRHIFIVLKEHYSQFTNKLHGYRGRSPLFYKSIKTLENVVFVDMSIPSRTLIESSVFVATQTGTAALEAALMQKKSLVFGVPWFLGIPNIHSYEDVNAFEDLIGKKTFDKSTVEKGILKYVYNYALPACVNPSGESGFKKKYGELFDVLIDDKLFSIEFAETVYKDYMGIKNVE